VEGFDIKIEQLDIPERAKNLLISEGITELFPPQEEAVKKGVLKGRNVVISAPTASGKTLVAELAILKKIFEEGGKALYMVPLRALANEKYEEFSKYEKIDLRVALSTGDYDSSDPWLENYNIIVTTNEKADSLIRHHAKWLKDVKVIVADEIHLITDQKRGPTLEVVLARLMQMRPDAQVLALSATIKNAQEIAEWLNAELILSNWRPVYLREGVYFRGEIEFNDGTYVTIPIVDSDPAVNIVLDTLNNGGQALVFLSTRKSTVALSARIARYLNKYLNNREKEQLKRLANEILKHGETTKQSKRLSELIEHGVAYHHAGLRYEHRKIIERSFRENLIKVVCATPTLAAGVNLPARRVIIRDHHRYSPEYGYEELPVLEYKQQAGRAGRPKYDDLGEAILIAKSEEERRYLFERYVFGEPEEITSKLATPSALRFHLLAMIATGYANTEGLIIKFLGKTFWGYRFKADTILNDIRDTLMFLTGEGLIEQRERFFLPTLFGKRVSELYIDPMSAIIIRKHLPIDGGHVDELAYLHLISYTPDMPKLHISKRDYEVLMEVLYEKEDELLIKSPDPDFNPWEFEEYLASLKTALMIYDWINEKSEDEILDKYNLGSGDLLRYAETAGWLVYAAKEIARLFELKDRVKELERLELRVKHGVKEELLELVSLKGIGRIKARALYNYGYKSIEDLRRARNSDLLMVPGIGPETIKKIREQIGGEQITEEVPKERRKIIKQTTIFDFST